jgi:hypothetical protein
MSPPATMEARTRERMSGRLSMPDWTAETPWIAWNQIGSYGATSEYGVVSRRGEERDIRRS